MHIIIYVHVYESVMWFRVNVRISAGKALHFALADDSFLLSTFPNPFVGNTWFWHAAVRDEKLICLLYPLSCGLVSWRQQNVKASERQKRSSLFVCLFVVVFIVVVVVFFKCCYGSFLLLFLFCSVVVVFCFVVSLFPLRGMSIAFWTRSKQLYCVSRDHFVALCWQRPRGIAVSATCLYSLYFILFLVPFSELCNRILLVKCHADI